MAIDNADIIFLPTESGHYSPLTCPDYGLGEFDQDDDLQGAYMGSLVLNADGLEAKKVKPYWAML